MNTFETGKNGNGSNGNGGHEPANGRTGGDSALPKAMR